ncbi:MAG: histidine kinase [Frankiales bacterium]|nr:histidine kinase [Frankiales bacterium]
MLVGTSGWQYADWKPLLYADVPQRLWLERHAELFATVEVNNAFYRLPRREVFEAWAARTPDDYVVTVKASRFLSHVKRLRDPQEPVARLMDRVEGLGKKLGAVLLQLPPTLPRDVTLLDDCLASFPQGTRVAVEPRHDSWWDPDVRDVLERRRSALVWADSSGKAMTPLWRTTDWGYLRLHHGPGDSWDYGYDGVRPWAARIAQTWAEEQDVYAYTNNDPTGAALRDAEHLAVALHRRGRTATRVATRHGLADPQRLARLPG